VKRPYDQEFGQVTLIRWCSVSREFRDKGPSRLSHARFGVENRKALANVPRVSAAKLARTIAPRGFRRTTPSGFRPPARSRRPPSCTGSRARPRRRRADRGRSTKPAPVGTPTQWTGPRVDRRTAPHRWRAPSSTALPHDQTSEDETMIGMSTTYRPARTRPNARPSQKPAVSMLPRDAE